MCRTKDIPTTIARTGDRGNTSVEVVGGSYNATALIKTSDIGGLVQIVMLVLVRRMSVILAKLVIVLLPESILMVVQMMGSSVLIPLLTLLLMPVLLL